MDLIGLLLLGGLAVWRATNMVVNEDEEGPFGLFEWVRSRIDPHQRTWVGRGLRCAFCVSFWLGMVLATVLGMLEVVSLPLIPVWGLAFSSVAVAYHKALGGFDVSR